MTKDEIRKMAREVGIKCYGDVRLHPEDIDRFAHLVAAHEQKRCIGIIYGQCGSDNVAQRTVDAIRSQS
jgi:hypothetical protein